MNDKTTSTLQIPKYAWVSAPIIAFAGIAIGILFIWISNPGISFMGIIIGEITDNSLMASAGIWGCIIGSFIICGIALLKPKRDLVSLLVPLFAILIFNPWSNYNTGLMMQILFAATITVIAVRLEKKYSEN